MATDEDLAPLEEIDTDTLPPLRMTEVGYSGLNIVNGVVVEECDRELRWPQCMLTYKKMLKDGTVAPAVELVQTMIANVPWYVKAPQGYEEELKTEVAFFNSVMLDMQHSWLAFVKQATSFVPFGFSCFEIVPRYRLKIKGSRYNDNYIGIRKLAVRSQDSISEFAYKNKGRDLSGVWQFVQRPTGRSQTRDRFTGDPNAGTVKDQFIPIDKILLFRNNPLKDSPIGVSPLNSVHESWKYKKAYESSEAHGVSADIQGLKILYIPPQYLKADASEEDKEVFEMYKRIMRNLHIGQESGLILPQVLDDTTGEQYFKFDIVSAGGSKAYDVGKIIARYNAEILTALYADFLTLGQSGVGSNALSETKMELVKLVINSKLEEIRDVLNHYLIPRLLKWNNWETEVYPTFEFGEVAETSLDEFSQAWQRMSATNGIAKTVKNINFVHSKMGLPDMLPEDMKQDELFELLAGGDSKSGEGLSTGLPSGTGSATGKKGNATTSNTSAGK